MGRRNYLIEGVSGTGKTTVATELGRRGLQAVHGDRELAYQGDPVTGEPTDTASHEHHLWDVDRVRALAADPSEAVTFFCGGSRNVARFIDLFDGVFVLDIDLDTLHRRLDDRPSDEFGAEPAERELIVRLHRTREDLPSTGVLIDATRPIGEVVDEILRLVDHPVRVTTCDTAETLVAAGGLFERYRQHYGQPPSERTLEWLTGMVASRMLAVHTAEVDSTPVGLATTHALPASLTMGTFWQLRDLYVLPDARGRGVATALVRAVREAAVAAGATRLSLSTEVDNHSALDLYRRLGFRPVDGLTSLTLDLRRA